MRFYVAKEVFDKCPNLEFGLVSVNGASADLRVQDIENMVKDGEEKCSNFLEGKKVKELEELQPYREAFREMGINPNRYMCAIEALMTRIGKGQGMPLVNSIVDLGNAVSLKHRLPIGAHDLDTMDGDFGVRVATSDDTFLPFGAEEREPVPEGEVVYVTGNRVRTRRWTWRQGEEGKILNTTSHVLFIVDGFSENHDEVIKARDEIAELLEKYLGGEIKEGIITKDNMDFETEK